MQVDSKNNFTSVGGGETSERGKSSAGMPAFPFDLNNIIGFQFDQLKLALEYLARQQGEQQILINELLGRGPGSRLQDFNDDALQNGTGGYSVGHSPRGDTSENFGKDFEQKDIEDRGRASPLQAASQANRLIGALTEKFESMQAAMNEQENRMVKLEHKSEVAEQGYMKSKCF